MVVTPALQGPLRGHGARGRKLRGWRKLAGSFWGPPTTRSSTATSRSTPATCWTTCSRCVSAAGAHVTVTHAVGRAVAHGLDSVPDLRVRLAHGREYARETTDVFFIVAAEGGELTGCKVERADEKSLVEIADELELLAAVHLERLRRVLRQGEEDAGPAAAPAAAVGHEPQRLAHLRPQPRPARARRTPPGVRQRDDHLGRDVGDLARLLARSPATTGCPCSSCRCGHPAPGRGRRPGRDPADADADGHVRPPLRRRLPGSEVRPGRAGVLRRPRGFRAGDRSGPASRGPMPASVARIERVPEPGDGASATCCWAGSPSTATRSRPSARASPTSSSRRVGAAVVAVPARTGPPPGGDGARLRRVGERLPRASWSGSGAPTTTAAPSTTSTATPPRWPPRCAPGATRRPAPTG